MRLLATAHLPHLHRTIAGKAIEVRTSVWRSCRWCCAMLMAMRTLSGCTSLAAVYSLHAQVQHTSGWHQKLQCSTLDLPTRLCRLAISFWTWRMTMPAPKAAAASSPKPPPGAADCIWPRKHHTGIGEVCMRKLAHYCPPLSGDSRQGAVVVAVARLQRRQAQQAGQVPGVRVQRLPP